MRQRQNDLLSHADWWFRRSRAALLESLPCRRGCHHCCIGIFAITRLDAAAIQDGLAGLIADVRDEIIETARRQTFQLAAADDRLTHAPFLDAWDDSAQDELVERFHELPCPALDQEGACRIYTHRPLICRLMGIPLVSEGRADGACHVQTFVPIRPLPHSLLREEDRLVAREMALLDESETMPGGSGEELFLPYGFLPNLIPVESL
jgi:Fe-S-cluster containining protein